MASVTILLNSPTSPVTSLAFINHYLLSGQGSYCRVYDVQSQERVYSTGAFQILSTSSIHGFRPHRNADYDLELSEREEAAATMSSSVDICVFGGHHLHVVCLHMSSGSIGNITQDLCLNDWIWDCHWIHTKTMNSSNNNENCTCSSHLAVITGHNSVAEICWPTKSTLRRVQCAEYCILYAAKLFGSSWSELLCAAGTVFNQVLLWEVNKEADLQGRVPVLQALTGHKGVITAIHYDPVYQKFVTSSDDRSIRVWKRDSCSLPQQMQQKCLSQCDFTGTFVEVGAFYGHTARVWDVRTLQDGSILSIAEDATCCMWDDAGHVLFKFKGHKGKNIWSLSVNKDNTLVATGGADASIRLWQIQAVKQGLNVHTTWLDLESVHKAGDFPRIVRMLGSTYVLVMFNSGLLVAYDTNLGHWNHILSDASYSSYSVMSVESTTNSVAIGNITGSILVLTLKVSSPFGIVSKTECHLYRGKVHSIHWLEAGRLLTCGPDGNMCMLKASLDDITIVIIPEISLWLPVSRQRWVTAACLLLQHNLLICGDRAGSILVYSLLTSRQGSDGQILRPIQLFTHIHSDTGVTFICYHDKVVYTCGRDGQYRQFTVCCYGNSLQYLASTKVAKGFDWLSAIVVHQSDIHVLGFHSNSFVMHNVNTNQQLLSISCGGGHRAWDYALSSDCLSLAYIKQRAIALYCVPIKSYQRIVEASLTGKHLTSVAHCFSETRCDCHWIATAGEDGAVNLMSVQDQFNGQLVTKLTATVRTHISSIRSLSVLQQRGLLLSAGGRGQLCAYRLPVSGGVMLTSKDKVDIELLSSYPHRQFGLKKLRLRQTNIRYMCVTSFLAQQLEPSLPACLVLVTAVSSDGCLRLFCFDDSSGSFYPVSEFVVDRSCLLQVQHLIVSNSSSDDSCADVDSCKTAANSSVRSNKKSEQPECRRLRSAYVLTGATNGSIALWDITDTVLTFCWTLVSKQQQCNNTREVDELVMEKDVIETELTQNDCNDSVSRDSSDNCSSDDDDEWSDSCCGVGSKVSSASQKFLLTQVAAHQAGVNVMALSSFQDASQCGSYTLVSGGDDCSVAVHFITFQSAESRVPHISLCCKHLSAHSAQVTGVVILSDSLFASASVDQRVIVWQLDVSTSTLMKLKSVYVDIADISSMECINVEQNRKLGETSTFKLAVCGSGVQFLTVVI